MKTKEEKNFLLWPTLLWDMDSYKIKNQNLEKIIKSAFVSGFLIVKQDNKECTIGCLEKKKIFFLPFHIPEGI